MTLRMNTVRSLVFFLSVTIFPIFAVGQEKSEKGSVDAPCRQDTAERDKIINEADENKINTWRVTIYGNTYTRYREFRKRFENGIGEGDIFTRSALDGTLKGISRMKTVYPITINDVKVWKETHPAWKVETINIAFCVRQKPKH